MSYCELFGIHLNYCAVVPSRNHQASGRIIAKPYELYRIIKHSYDFLEIAKIYCELLETKHPQEFLESQ